MPNNIKRHEFREKPVTDKTDAFVVFEGHEETPFWNRVNDGIRFVFTNLSYKQALAFTEQSIVDHTIVECDAAEYDNYFREATRQHNETSTLIKSATN